MAKKQPNPHFIHPPHLPNHLLLRKHPNLPLPPNRPILPFINRPRPPPLPRKQDKNDPRRRIKRKHTEKHQSRNKFDLNKIGIAQ